MPKKTLIILAAIALIATVGIFGANAVLAKSRLASSSHLTAASRLAKPKPVQPAAVSTGTETSTTADDEAALTDGGDAGSEGGKMAPTENNTKSAQARVIKVLAEKDVYDANGTKTRQQNLQLLILTGTMAGQTVEYDGISDIIVTDSGVYKAGDKVFISIEKGGDGKYSYYVIDYVRSDALMWLLILFVTVILAIGWLKGFRALLGFFLSFFFIIKVMVPLFLISWNPLIVGFVGSLVILVLIIYLTEGYNKKSHVAALSIAASLVFTAILAYIFVGLTHLTGQANEDVAYLIQAMKQPIDFRLLLLASMFIGTLGVLDDVVMSQVESVLQIKAASPEIENIKCLKMAMKVGQSHLGAIINTLFLAYVGTALPLILLFNLHQQPFVTFQQVVNNEQIATEIVRTLVGVVGLCSAIPISTWLAVRYLSAKDGEETGGLKLSRLKLFNKDK